MSILFPVAPLIVPVIVAFPETQSFSDGEAVPIPTFPVLLMTNGVASGFVLSSTTSEFPVPV